MADYSKLWSIQRTEYPYDVSVSPLKYHTTHNYYTPDRVLVSHYEVLKRKRSSDSVTTESQESESASLTNDALLDTSTKSDTKSDLDKESIETQVTDAKSSELLVVEKSVKRNKHAEKLSSKNNDGDKQSLNNILDAIIDDMSTEKHPSSDLLDDVISVSLNEKDTKSAISENNVRDGNTEFQKTFESNLPLNEEKDFKSNKVSPFSTSGKPNKKMKHGQIHVEKSKHEEESKSIKRLFATILTFILIAILTLNYGDNITNEAKVEPTATQPKKAPDSNPPIEDIENIPEKTSDLEDNIECDPKIINSKTEVNDAGILYFTIENLCERETSFNIEYGGPDNLFNFKHSTKKTKNEELKLDLFMGIKKVSIKFDDNDEIIQLDLKRFENKFDNLMKASIYRHGNTQLHIRVSEDATVLNGKSDVWKGNPMKQGYAQRNHRGYLSTSENKYEVYTLFISEDKNRDIRELAIRVGCSEEPDNSRSLSYSTILLMPGEKEIKLETEEEIGNGICNQSFPNNFPNQTFLNLSSIEF